MEYFIAGSISAIALIGIVSALVFLFIKIKKLEKANAEQDEVLLEMSNVVARLGVEYVSTGSKTNFNKNCVNDLSFPNSEGF